MKKPEKSQSIILSINTIDRNKIEIGLYNGKALECFEFETDMQSEDLLIAINGTLKKQKISVKNLTAILVNQGPGSFTGTRVGVTTANTLGWSLNIPVYGYHNENFEEVFKKIVENYQNKFSKSVIPFYK
ncbi:MAG: glycoprotein endopeptidase [Berkelbacteria bacterium GW2011_GWB1_38_5]|uniref:Glycoprotein endopeptidase n=1 Tax=Berkelbacteria bacterium GW2011_GWB1_38_5 TaxID=1618336 RepID=A0A0G0NBC4_9BACT|nr:MAG: glycoprotein endopeptidase [Berkelbacteria bacterium GW2011_GWB1_38_5]